MRQPGLSGKSSRFAFFGLALCLILTTAWVARIEGLEKERNQERAQREKLSVEELLDRLLQERAADFNDSKTLRLYYFGRAPVESNPDDEFDAWVTELVGYPKVGISPILAELVRRGTAAVPHLLEHLEDPRPTRWVFQFGEWDGTLIFGNGYDARNLDPRKHPPGTVAKRWATDLTLPDPEPEDIEILDPPQTSYTFTVGDVCSMILGEIVNRRLGVVHRIALGLSVSTTIQSPVHIPALAKACRDDWSGLTSEKHKQSLLNDANRYDMDLVLGAIDRLAYYYPQDAENLLVKLLKRPIYDDGKVLDFINSELLELSPSLQSKLKNYFHLANILENKTRDLIKDPFIYSILEDMDVVDIIDAIQFDQIQLHKFSAMQITKINSHDRYRDLIGKFKSASKDNSWITLPYWLHNVCEPDYMYIDILLYGKAALANQISALAFPDYDPFNPDYIDAASVEDQVRLLMLLHPFSSARVDQAIHDLFRKAIEPNPLFGDSPDWGKSLANQCIKHLAGKSYDPELRAFLESQIKKLKEHTDPEETQWERKNLERLLQHLRN